MYNHYKHGNLSSKEQAIIRNQNDLIRTNNEVENEKSSSEMDKKNMVLIKTIDRNISIAINGVVSLPPTHLESFETIWFNLKEKIEDYSRNKNLDEKTEHLIVKLMNSEEYRNEKLIESQQDICGRLNFFSNTVNSYLE